MHVALTIKLQHYFRHYRTAPQKFLVKINHGSILYCTFTRKNTEQSMYQINELCSLQTNYKVVETLESYILRISIYRTSIQVGIVTKSDQASGVNVEEK